jgi:prepilin-type N-terminal cleavage/methylation domain-containing protein
MTQEIFINKKAFTLIEVIVSVAIITTAFIALITLISFSISSFAISKTKITAFGLAQEGLEIVRSIRDNNWLNYKRTAVDWRDGIVTGDHLVQYNVNALLEFNNIPLKIDNTGFYQYDNGTNTSFYRKITISDIDENQFRVVVSIEWSEKGKNYSMSAESRLYNWLKEEDEE